MNCIIHASVCYWAEVSDSGHNKLLSSVWLQVASIIDKFIPVRVSDTDENNGLDLSLHGEEAYVLHELIEKKKEMDPVSI